MKEWTIVYKEHWVLIFEGSPNQPPKLVVLKRMFEDVKRIVNSMEKEFICWRNTDPNIPYQVVQEMLEVKYENYARKEPFRKAFMAEMLVDIALQLKNK